MQTKIWMMVGSFLLCGLAVLASGPREVLMDGNQRYESGQYQAAIEAYESVLEQGMESAALYYNLGNSYYKDGQLGKAILHYERALMLKPGDADVRNNLALARLEVADEFIVLPQFFLFAWWDGLRSLAASRVWALLGLLCLWVGFGGLVWWQRGSTRTARKRGFFAGWGLLTAAVLLLALSFSRKHWEEKSGYAVILSPEMQLQVAPDAASEIIRTVHEGTKVAVRDEIGGWYKVELPNGALGWLEGRGIEAI